MICHISELQHEDKHSQYLARHTSREVSISVIKLVRLAHTSFLMKPGVQLSVIGRRGVQNIQKTDYQYVYRNNKPLQRQHLMKYSSPLPNASSGLLTKGFMPSWAWSKKTLMLMKSKNIINVSMWFHLSFWQ